jgi:hypothetical protein
VVSIEGHVFVNNFTNFYFKGTLPFKSQNNFEQQKSLCAIIESRMNSWIQMHHAQGIDKWVPGRELLLKKIISLALCFYTNFKSLKATLKTEIAR